MVFSSRQVKSPNWFQQAFTRFSRFSGSWDRPCAQISVNVTGIASWFPFSSFLVRLMKPEKTSARKSVCFCWCVSEALLDKLYDPAPPCMLCLSRSLGWRTWEEVKRYVCWHRRLHHPLVPTSKIPWLTTRTRQQFGFLQLPLYLTTDFYVWFYNGLFEPTLHLKAIRRDFCNAFTLLGLPRYGKYVKVCDQGLIHDTKGNVNSNARRNTQT